MSRSARHRTAASATRLPTNKAGPRAFSPTSLVAQRDAGTGRRTLRAFASSCALTAWAGAADSAAAYPGMAACRCPSPDWIQIEDTGGTRIILAAVPAARHCAMTGDQLRGQDDGPRAACTCGRRCQRHGNPEDPVGGIMTGHRDAVWRVSSRDGETRGGAILTLWLTTLHGIGPSTTR
jgi:hypothetical protein